MLIGEYIGKISQKGRVAVPKKFRIHLGKHPIITRWYEGCLIIVSETDWRALLNRLTGDLRHLSLLVRATDRFLLGTAYEIDWDYQGRFVIPPKLRKYADFSGGIVFLGLMDRVEVWDKEKWKKYEEEVSKGAGQLMERLIKEK